MKLNVQTQTADVDIGSIKPGFGPGSKLDMSNRTDLKSDYNSKKDIHLSDIQPDLPPLDESPLLNFEGLNAPIKTDSGADPLGIPKIGSSLFSKKGEEGPGNDENRETMKLEVRHRETQDACVGADLGPRVKEVVVEKKVYVKEKIEGGLAETGLGLEEGGDLLYSCVVSYAHEMFSNRQHDREHSEIMKKCLEQGKFNFPDLFLRFID